MRKFIRSPWAPFECPLPFSKKWKNFIPRKNSFPVGSKIDPVPLHTVRKSKRKEKKPVFNYYCNTFLPKRFLIVKSPPTPIPKKLGSQSDCILSKYSLQTSSSHATLAQLVEHLTCNEDVVGSIPTGGSIFVHQLSEYSFPVLDNSLLHDLSV